MELETDVGLKSRMQENCTYGSVRGSRQAFHVEFMKGVSRLSTRREPMGTIKDKIILLVDDEPAILQMCQSILKENGFENIVTANTALSALERMSAKPDMAVLDVMLPDMDGFMLAKTIREQNPIPILFLTAKGEIDDKSKGFEAGADDYMVKPFIAQEFVWRITAILRRTYKESEESSFLLDACKVDLEQAEVYREGQEPVSLTAKEVEILKKLYANAGRIVTLGALCQTVCGDIYIGYEKTLMSHIRHIREKIEEKPSSPVSLVTVKGIGYKLILKDKSR